MAETQLHQYALEKKLSKSLERVLIAESKTKKPVQDELEKII